MRQGTVIDPETAKRITDSVMESVLAGGQFRQHMVNVRPVIWPHALAKAAMEIEDVPAGQTDIFPIPQRQLCHLICTPEMILVMAHMPQFYVESGRTGSMLILRYAANYSGHIIKEDFPLIFAFSSEVEQRLKALYHAIARQVGAKIKDHVILNLPNMLDDCLTTGMLTDELAPFIHASRLEHYAFGTYAVTRPRPTSKQATNPNPKKKGYAALEVVSLRLPEKRKDAEPGTGKKLDMRIQVSEHLRRQPTKTGIKLITIASHERGPKDAPLKPRANKVYKVIK